MVVATIHSGNERIRERARRALAAGDWCSCAQLTQQVGTSAGRLALALRPWVESGQVLMEWRVLTLVRPGNGKQDRKPRAFYRWVGGATA